MLLISAIIFPTNWYLYQWASGSISEVINENSLSSFDYLDDFSLIVTDIMKIERSKKVKILRVPYSYFQY